MKKNVGLLFDAIASIAIVALLIISAVAVYSDASTVKHEPYVQTRDYTLWISPDEIEGETEQVELSTAEIEDETEHVEPSTAEIEDYFNGLLTKQSADENFTEVSSSEDIYVEELPVEELPAEELPVEETPVEELPVEEPSTEKVSSDEPQSVESHEGEENVSDIETVPYYSVTHLNVRTGPGTSYKKIGAFEFKDEIQVLKDSEGDHWVQVLYDGQIAYCSSNYLVTEISNVSESKVSLSSDDMYLLAQILECEAGGEGKAEMARVGQVVLNRMTTDYREHKQNDSIYSVLTQKGQYPDTLKKIRSGKKPSRAALEVAAGLVDGTIVPDFGDAQRYLHEILWQTGFYPSWGVVVYQSDAHYYAIPKEYYYY